MSRCCRLYSFLGRTLESNTIVQTTIPSGLYGGDILFFVPTMINILGKTKTRVFRIDLFLSSTIDLKRKKKERNTPLHREEMNTFFCRHRYAFYLSILLLCLFIVVANRMYASYRCWQWQVHPRAAKFREEYEKTWRIL
jgi:hypothetical protein